MKTPEFLDIIVKQLYGRISNATRNELNHPVLEERLVARYKREAYEVALGDVQRLIADNWKGLVRE